MNLRIGLTLAALALCVPFPLSAQDRPALELPQNPGVWMNSGPISLSALEGKAVVLYYFEKNCPRCSARWPELNTAAASFQGEPIMFIAVNSGTAPRDLANYARQNNISWPLIADVDRSLEQLSNVGQISLQNIYQMRVVLPNGQVRPGNPGDIAGEARRALEGASWKVDPKEIPAELQAAWSSVEFGNFPAGAAAINRAARSGKAEVRTAAEKLLAFVNTELESQLTQAQAQTNAGQNWQAYRTYAQMQEMFKGYDLPDSVAENVKELANDQSVKAELAAMKQLEALKRRLAVANPRAVNPLITQLRRLIETSPGTEASGEAADILQQLGATP